MAKPVPEWVEEIAQMKVGATIPIFTRLDSRNIQYHLRKFGAFKTWRIDDMQVRVTRVE